MISLASAMYAGESKTFDLQYEIANCSIIGNTHNLEGLNLTWEDTNFTISTVVNYKPDNFMISCWVIKYKEEVVVSVYHSSGGGSSSSSSIVYVVDNVSGKDYGDASKYPTYNDKEIVEEDLPEEEQITIELITEEGKLHWILWLIGGVLILLTIYFIFFRREHHTLSQEEHTNEENLS